MKKENFHYYFGCKYFIVCVLLLLDIVCNSSGEYEDLFKTSNVTTVASTLLTYIIQVLGQVMAFLMLFGLLGSTFLFQNGLLGILCSRFKGIILLSILYILLTVGLGLYRLVGMDTDLPLQLIWDDYGYYAASVGQKIVAMLYYVKYMITMIQLGDPRYYAKDEWIALYQ